MVAAYLCLVNLDYAALWHDEAPAAFFGKTLLQQGDIVGWDGRNLVGGINGRTLNEELRDVLPPLMYVLNAVGFAIFGINEMGARIVHAILGIAALGVFYLLLRQHLPKHPRLRFFIFAFAAGSAQLLLYFRQSRYFSVMVLALLLLFYLYERYWQSRNSAYLPVIALVAALSFFNHYAVAQQQCSRWRRITCSFALAQPRGGSGRCSPFAVRLSRRWAQATSTGWASSAVSAADSWDLPGKIPRRTKATSQS